MFSQRLQCSNGSDRFGWKYWKRERVFEEKSLNFSLLFQFPTFLTCTYLCSKPLAIIFILQWFQRNSNIEISYIPSNFPIFKTNRNIETSWKRKSIFQSFQENRNYRNISSKYWRRIILTPNVFNLSLTKLAPTRLLNLWQQFLFFND